MVQQDFSGKKVLITGSSRRVGRVATTDEIAGAIAYLASEQAEYIAGCILDMNGASYLRS